MCVCCVCIMYVCAIIISSNIKNKSLTELQSRQSIVPTSFSLESKYRIDNIMNRNAHSKITFMICST